AAVLVGYGLLVHDDDWGDRSLLEASFARLRERPVLSAGQPRYVGASALLPSRRASDAIAFDEPPPLEGASPMMRTLEGEDPKPWAAVPVIDVAPQAAAPTQAPPIVVAQAPSPAPTPTARATVPADATRPGNKEIENLVVELIAYYEAGDADGLVGLVDGGFW